MKDKKFLSAVENIMNKNTMQLIHHMDLMEERLLNKIDSFYQNLNNKLDCLEQRLSDQQTET